MKEQWVNLKQDEIDELAEQGLRDLEVREREIRLGKQTSTRGLKHDSGKAPLHMIPEVALTGAAEAFAFGASKYERFNYRKGIEYSRLTDSLRRHTLAFLRGEDIDPDSGLHHTKLILANAAMLEFMRVYKPEMDDRWKPSNGGIKSDQP